MLLSTSPSAKFEIIREMISRDDNVLNLKWLCDIAGVTRQGYYFWLKSERKRNEREECDKSDFSLVLEAYKFRGYDKGYRGIYMRLLHLDPPVVMNGKKIRRLMEKFGLKCPIRRVNPYRKMARAMQTSNVAPNLLNRQFRAFGPRSILLTDITYIPRYSNSAERKFSYVSVIMDAYTKQILAFTVSLSLEVDFVLDTVNMLVENHGAELKTNVLIHSDQGCHYTSHAFQTILSDKNLRQSMSRKGNCWDNAPQESFFGHMKDHLKVL